MVAFGYFDLFRLKVLRVECDAKLLDIARIPLLYHLLIGTVQPANVLILTRRVSERVEGDFVLVRLAAGW